MPALGKGEMEGVWTIRGKEERDEMSSSLHFYYLFSKHHYADPSVICHECG
jgi:hypothetical protein